MATSTYRIGDSAELLKELEPSSVDLIVTDPPYALTPGHYDDERGAAGGFMGKKWDASLPVIDIWKECCRVLKPGAFAFILMTPRQDCLWRAMRDLEQSGFNINFSSLYFTYATGFPKALNIGKKTQSPALKGAYAGAQFKPAVEVIMVAMKPLEEKTYVDQALANGHGCTWLDNGRIPFESEDDQSIAKPWGRVHPERGNYPGWELDSKMVPAPEPNAQGRFPANLLVSDDVLDDGTVTKSSGDVERFRNKNGEKTASWQGRDTLKDLTTKTTPCDAGGFSRYFSLDKWAEQLPFLIVPKASKGEKNKGIANGDRCTHPTVKPLKLMSYLITLGSRPGEVVLDPFAGSGTTLLAARMLNRSSIGFELSPEYVEILKARTGWLPPPLESFSEGAGP